MRMGEHRDTLAPSLAAADAVWLFAPPDLGWDPAAVVHSLGT
jgi:UDP-N-acetylmuramate: L-alanyl-gamma-D-glutamyl-meso-diaminopimelate ligase